MKIGEFCVCLHKITTSLATNTQCSVSWQPNCQMMFLFHINYLMPALNFAQSFSARRICILQMEWNAKLHLQSIELHSKATWTLNSKWNTCLVCHSPKRKKKTIFKAHLSMILSIPWNSSRNFYSSMFSASFHLKLSVLRWEAITFIHTQETKRKNHWI